MLDESRCSVVIKREYLPEAPSSAALQVMSRVISIDEEREEIAQESGEGLEGLAVGENLAYVMFTSGTTGEPKGIGITKRAVLRLVKQEAYARFGDEEVMLHNAPLTFDASTFEIWGSLLNGGKLVVVGEEKKSLSELGEEIQVEGVSTVWLTAGLFQLMVEQEIEGLKGVKQLLAGGDVLPVKQVTKALRELEGKLINGYGPTESTTFACCEEIQSEQEGRSMPIGRAISNTSAYVVDQEGEIVAIGVMGELLIGGDGLARGYIRRGDRTGEKFVPDNISGRSGERLYRTGDICRYQSDGKIQYAGRRDGQVKVRGYRIELGEVEEELRRQEGIREAGVVIKGEGSEKRLVGYVVLEEGREISQEKIKEGMRARAPEYMVPGVIVKIEEMPLTGNGKVDRRALGVIPERETEESERGEGVRTEIEEMTAGIWEEVLGVRGIRTRDNFFEMGGHSLLATQAVSRIRELMKVELPLRVIFEEGTVAGVSREIERRLTGGRSETRAIRRRADKGKARLSTSQQRIWILEQMEPGTSTYNIPVVVRIKGELDEEALEASLRELTKRHESLRTTIEEEEAEPVQIIHDDIRIELRKEDLRAESGEGLERLLREIGEEEGRGIFDLQRGPLVRYRLVRVGEAERMFYLTMHHIISDGWSIGVMGKDLAELYRAKKRGEEAKLGELQVQYGDYAEWESERKSGEAEQEQLSYWKEQLRGEHNLIELGGERRRSAVRKYEGRTVRHRLNSEIVKGLREVNRREGVTMYMSLLAGFKALMSRLSGEEDIRIGAPVAGRMRSELEGLIGLVLNTVVIRTEVKGEERFRELLDRVREATLGAYANQETAYERVLEELEIKRDLSTTPVFQVMFNMLNFPHRREEVEGIKIELEKSAEVGSKFDLTMYIGEEGEEIAINGTYDASLYEEERIKELMRQYETVLKQAVKDTEIRIDEISLRTEKSEEVLPDPEEELSGRWEGTVVERVIERAKEAGQRASIRETGKEWSYAEVEEASRKIAAKLKRAGVRRGEVVGIWGERTGRLVVSVLGVMRAGAAFLILEGKYPGKSLRERLEISGARVVVEASDKEKPEELEGYIQEAGIKAVSANEERESIEGARSDETTDETTEWKEEEIGAEDIAYISFTSGSTGTPKAILGTHGPVAHFVDWHIKTFALTGEDRFSMLSGLSHDPLQRDMFTPLSLGAALCIPDDTKMGDGERLVEWMTRESITAIHLTPAMAQLMASASDGKSAGKKLDSVRHAFFGADILTLQDVNRFRELAPAAECVNFYGATETPQAMGFFKISADASTSDKPLVEKETIPIGFGIEGVQLLVLNNSRLAGIGEKGEICVRTSYLTQGYINDGMLTTERFITNPFTQLEGDRVYRTGDLGRYQADGTIELIGRADNQVKIRGYRIEPAEIEAVLETHPSITGAAVVARSLQGQDKSIVAYGVAQEGLAPDTAELRRFLRQRLADYMIPAAFVKLDRLPLTPNGKIDPRALPEPALNAAEYGFTAPRNPIEEVLASIWSDLLGGAPVGIYDNFFELGGHSLLATRVVSRVRKIFGVEIQLRALFESPTVASMAQWINEAGRERSNNELSLEPVSIEGEAPLSFGQQRLWFIDQLEGGTAYNLSAAFRLRGAADPRVLERTINEIVGRHGSLRTTFSIVDGAPVQIVRANLEIPLMLVDLKSFSKAEREHETEQLALEQTAQRFDLQRGPLLRASLLCLEPDEHVLLFTLHHVVADAWSLGIFVKEAVALYEAFLNDGDSPLLPLPIQYTDYAVWQRRWLQGAVLEEHLDYWRGQLAGARTMLDLPTDKMRPPIQSYRGAKAQFLLPSSLADSLNALSRRESATLFMTLLAAFETLLWRYSGQIDISIGTPIAGRT